MRDRLEVEPNSFTTVSPHLSRTLETLNNLLLHFVGKPSYQMTPYIYLPFSVVKSTNTVAERILVYKVAATWCCLKHLRKICTFYCAHFCRMKQTWPPAE
jgi:hypothetical protein